MANNNESLNKAGVAKKDEFYTQRGDIENELKHYKSFFKGKTVFCNCDDPYESNFVKYFAMNYNALGLKKLIATCYATSSIMHSQISFFGSDEVMGVSYPKKKPYKIELTEILDENGDGAIGLDDFEQTLRKHPPTFLKGDGDFRSPECIELLKQADVVVTNPPFSLFREYIAQLVHFGKKFIIIGNQNAITYKEVFTLIRDNKIWLGYHSGDMAFEVPDNYEPRETRFWIDERGKKWRSMGNICWFTNIDIQKRHGELVLYKHYNPDDYPAYDNYEAIEVKKTSDIPCDYDGIMGVPITFMDKYNPDQFEIVGATESEGKGFSNGLWNEASKVAQPLVNGERKYKRIFIRRRTANGNPT